MKFQLFCLFLLVIFATARCLHNDAPENHQSISKVYLDPDQLHASSSLSTSASNENTVLSPRAIKEERMLSSIHWHESSIGNLQRERTELQSRRQRCRKSVQDMVDERLKSNTEDVQYHLSRLAELKRKLGGGEDTTGLLQQQGSHSSPRSGRGRVPPPPPPERSKTAPSFSRGEGSRSKQAAGTGAAESKTAKKQGGGLAKKFKGKCAVQ